MYRYIDLTERPCKLVDSNNLSDLCLIIKSDSSRDFSEGVVAYSSNVFPLLQTKDILVPMERTAFELLVYYEKNVAVGFAFGRTQETGTLNPVASVGKVTDDYIVIPRNNMSINATNAPVLYNWYGSTSIRFSFSIDNMVTQGVNVSTVIPGKGILSTTQLDPRMGGRNPVANPFTGGYVSC